jgi:hypothetical protein
MYSIHSMRTHAGSIACRPVSLSLPMCLPAAAQLHTYCPFSRISALAPDRSPIFGLRLVLCCGNHPALLLLHHHHGAANMHKGVHTHAATAQDVVQTPAAESARSIGPGRDWHMGLHKHRHCSFSLPWQRGPTASVSSQCSPDTSPCPPAQAPSRAPHLLHPSSPRLPMTTRSTPARSTKSTMASPGHFPARRGSSGWVCTHPAANCSKQSRGGRAGRQCTSAGAAAGHKWCGAWP